MLNWKLTLHKLFFMHEWEETDSQRMKTYDSLESTIPIKQAQVYTLRCKACGTLKRKKIKL